MSDSTRPVPAAADRPPKPYPDFPLYAHPLGYWSKKIDGKIQHFHRWGRIRGGKMERLPDDGWADALKLFKERYPDVVAGRVRQTVVPEKQEDADVFTVATLCNDFLVYKDNLRKSGEITDRTFAEYRQTTDRLVAFFGKKRAVDEIKRSEFMKLRASIAWGPVRLGNEVVRIRSVFKYSRKADLVPDEFKKPSAKVLRKHRAERSKRLFSDEELRWLLEGKTVKDEDGGDKYIAGASPQLKAMILLGINCGMGNADVADLPKSALDLDGGWIEFPRPKTGIERRCPLWPETVSALRIALADRPKPASKKDAACVFLTPEGHRCVRDAATKKTLEGGIEQIEKCAQINAVGVHFGKLLGRLGINGRTGLGFYSLRHTFRTIADATKDFPAIRLIMGHADGSIDAVYREGIDDDRLEAVAAHVRKWLFGEGVK